MFIFVTSLLGAIKIACEHLTLNECLKTIGISSARYHQWKVKERGCELEDYSSCPKYNPTRLTFDEIRKMGDLVTSEEHMHFSIRSLAIYAMRQNLVYASPTTWGRLIKSRGWIRPKKRIYPEKPKIGIRSNMPNGIWHIDVSVMKLLDGTRAYIQAIIDNFSRFIVAWKISTSISGLSTKQLLEHALKKTDVLSTIDVLADGGPENINNEVYQLQDYLKIKLTIAQIEIDFSNSMIENFFKNLKHRYLYLKSLNNLSTFKAHSSYYIEQHNNIVPQHVLGGATPEEAYYGTWNKDKEEELVQNHLNAQKARIEYHKSLACRICSPENVESSPSPDVTKKRKM